MATPRLCATKSARESFTNHEMTKAAALPTIGIQDVADEQMRLMEGAQGQSGAASPALAPLPLPSPARPAHTSPTAEATALDMQKMCRASDISTQLMHLASADSFKVARSKDPRRSARAPAAPTMPRARRS